MASTNSIALAFALTVLLCAAAVQAEPNSARKLLNKGNGITVSKSAGSADKGPSVTTGPVTAKEVKPKEVKVSYGWSTLALMQTQQTVITKEGSKTTTKAMKEGRKLMGKGLGITVSKGSGSADKGPSVTTGPVTAKEVKPKEVKVSYGWSTLALMQTQQTVITKDGSKTTTKAMKEGR